MHKLNYILIKIILLSNLFILSEKLRKFDPTKKEERQLFLDVTYNCEYNGFINLNKDFILHYCFFAGEDDHNGLVFRKFFTKDLVWGNSLEVLRTNKKINLFIFVDDYLLEKLILIYSYDRKIRITVFNNYTEPSDHIDEISLSYDILHKFNMISKITYFYQSKKSLCVCGMNRDENIFCTFSFDYGLSMEDDNSIEFVLKKKIPMGHYRMEVKFEEDYVYFNLFDDLNDINFYELKCIKLDDKYECDILNKVIKDLDNFKYKHILRNEYFEMVAFEKENMCYIGWSFNYTNINNEINRIITESPCSNVSSYYKNESLIITYKKSENENIFYTIFENLVMKVEGCEYKSGGSLYVMNNFLNNSCVININNMNVTSSNHDEINFSIVVPSKFNLQEKCFLSNHLYKNKKTNLYYLEEENKEEEDIKIYTFYFYKYILTFTNFAGSKCIFESNNKEKLEVSLISKNFYKEYNCDISLDSCDFFVHSQSKINIRYNDEWIIDRELAKSNVIYNESHISLYDIISFSNVNELITINNNMIQITIPSIIPHTRTIKIEFTKNETEEKRNVFIRFQKDVYPIKKVLGVNFSDIFDIYYKYYNYYNDKVKFLLNEFEETSYIGMICQTKNEITSEPCSLALTDFFNKLIQIQNLFPKTMPFLYYNKKKKIQSSNSYFLTETRFVVFKNFGSFLEKNGIKYANFICKCPSRNSNSNKFNEINFTITNERISPDVLQSPEVIEESKSSEDSKVSEISDTSKSFKPFKFRELPRITKKTSERILRLTNEINDESSYRENFSNYFKLNIFILIITLIIT
ncbi:6-cysteine protein [Plasmodium gallinaceum]|uniref:6-cysteine protein n=1 Tax=Plasmodium gallinaceum TaxID=5849 RepID=A0A1J1GSJ9_PLAGA|nr:6-cysteine protein [Plasmodium gallinaceum]CRG94288.1 6-cysteine protein [Plasmodium gallinaceum]